MIFVRQSSVTNYEPVVLTVAQCVDILANLAGLYRVLVLTDAATGLRISEILALRWSDIDRAHSCIRVTRAYVYGKFGPPNGERVFARGGAGRACGGALCGTRDSRHPPFEPREGWGSHNWDRSKEIPGKVGQPPTLFDRLIHFRYLTDHRESNIMQI